MLDMFTQAGIIHWVKGFEDKRSFDVVIHNYAHKHEDEVDEFLNLLDLPLPEDNAGNILLPVKFALKSSQDADIAVETRSTMDLVEILRASVEVPEEHSASGFTVQYSPTDLAGDKIHIQMAEKRPQTASVAVNYSGYWFYIDRSDQRTKIIFRTLCTLVDVIIAKTAGQQPIPVLTVPVSR